MFILCLVAALYLGDYTQGEIQIIEEPCRVAEIEVAAAKRWRGKGWSEQEASQFARTGVVAEDPYWLWVRDPVIFPSGAMGTYNRIVWRQSLEGLTGVVVVPVTEEGRIMVNVNFRHATRIWEMELPRGCVEKGEAAEHAALGELKEETGLEVESLRLLGSVPPDTGLTTAVCDVFLGKVSAKSAANQEESEAIEGIYPMRVEDLKRGFAQGRIRVGERDVYLRDPFLAYALIVMEAL